MFDALDRIDQFAEQQRAGLQQYTSATRQLMQMLGGLTPANGTKTAAPIAAPTMTTPVASPEPTVPGVPDADAILKGKKKTAAAKKPAAKKGGRRKAAAPATPAPTGEAAGTDETTEASTDQPSLRSVCFSILSRPENLENGLKAGGTDGPSVLKVIVDEKLWVSKKNGNMPALISQCLHTLKKDGKVTRNKDTHCFIVKPGATLD
jgi:hypothetical protein